MQDQPIPEKLQISPFLVFYMIMSMQIGIGVLGYQRIISKQAGYDGWISVLFAGASIHIILWMIYKIVETVNGDIVTANVYVAGNIAGKILSTLFIVYLMILSMTVIRSFIEVIQSWMFPELSTFWFTLAYMLLCIYIVFGGFRTLVGIAFFGLVLPAYLLLTFGFTIKFSDYQELLPIMDHSIKELMMGAYKMSLTFTGFEILLFFYPFIKDPQKSKKWAHFAVLTTTFIYTGLAIMTFAYFSEEQLDKTIWATLTMWKIVKLPFVERFEYIGIANWSIIILPNICITLWAASRLMKRIFKLQQKKGIFFISSAVLIVINFFNTRDEINMLNDFTGKMGFALNYIYIPLLFIAIMIVKKVKKQ